MYFKKLELCGFKSFAGKTTLHFEPGITAVVGPNGCGKSNIFDSMRWCLGEQSIKSLRGAKMEDVIFNGTETVPAQNMAEVSLTISNEAKILPIDYEEVTISRRLFRSGESEYLINNNLVRLKDINELLMGTGIGAESYSLVEQGKIDLVISSRPEDRRLVFDEATGVSKYKAKKKEAMNRLDETDNNLLRINDIITEVKRQIGSIERQASKARRYKEIFENLKSAELKYSTYELKCAKSELLLLVEMVKKNQEDEQGLNAQLQELDRKLISHQKELQDLDATLSALKEEMSDLENTSERNRQHIGHNQERILDLNKHVEILLNQKDQLKQKIAAHERNIAELTEQFLSLHKIFAEKDNLYKAKETEFSTLNASIETAQNQNKAFRDRIFNINLNETQCNNQLNANASNLHSLLARQRRLDTEKVKTEDENSILLKDLETLQAEVAQHKATVQEIQGRWEGLKQEKSRLEQELKIQEEALRKLENEKLSLNSQVDFLKELKLKYDSMPEASQGILEIKNVPQEKVTGIIAHAREVKFDDQTKTYRISCELKFISFDLDYLESKIQELGKAIEEAIRAMNEKEQNLMTVVQKTQETNDELQQAKATLMNKDAVLSNVSSNAKRVQEELSLMSLELKEIGENLVAAQTKEQQLKTEHDSLKSESSTIENQISENIQKIAQWADEKEHMLVALTQLKTELTNQKAAEDSLQANLSFFQDALVDDSTAIHQHDQEIKDSQDKTAFLTQEIASLESEINANQDHIESKSKELSRLSSTRTEVVNGLDFVQKQIIDLEEKTDKTKEEAHRYQMQEQELIFKHTNIKNRVLQAYNIDLDETPVGDEMLADINMETLSQEITTLKEKVESFGTVNLVAIEELEELKNRHDFLTQQQNDLLQAKDSLQKAILKINRTTRKMFLETFQLVAEEFKNYFKLLFGGGEARLFLLDEEDVLESGIEIICRPPGKKLQNISLLSGGEKTLSAIALIFAIFKTKPSPFCVLDEIDAALDESNIGRFSRMLGDFAKTSQFIVITHNKKTISMANAMYGITMEQSGMSKIVSVKLHENVTGKDSGVRTAEAPSSDKKELSSEAA